jgi:tetratricopeptide (TPR) repeat protein
LGKILDEALVFVQKALEFEQSNGAYLDTLGWVYYKKGEINKAVRYLENASVLTEDAEIFEHLGDAYLEMGRSEEARKNWQKSLALDHQRKQVKEKIRKLKKNK